MKENKQTNIENPASTDGLVWRSKQKYQYTASQPPPICDMAPNNQDGKPHHFTGAPLSRTQELTPRPLTPRAQELLDSDLRRENERRQEDNNRWQEEAEQQNQLVLNHQQQQQVHGQGDEVEIVEVVNVAPANNGEVEVRIWNWKCNDAK